MPQLFKVDKSGITLYKFRSARRFSDSSGRLGQAEQAIQFCKDSNGTQPHSSICVEFLKESELKGLDSGAAVLPSFFQLANSLLQGASYISSFRLDV